MCSMQIGNLLVQPWQPCLTHGHIQNTPICLPGRGPVKVVPFIQLDLNPDMEDAGDDFGSDEFEEVSGSDNDSDSD